MSPTKKPVHEIRLGCIKAAVWENQTGESILHNVTFNRSYRDNQNAWHSTDSFGRDDLLALAKLADQAHTWIHEHRSPRGGPNGAQSQPPGPPSPKPMVQAANGGRAQR